MKLIFGMACDGPFYPDFPGTGEGVVDEAVVGPSGLVGTLEIQLGLTAPRIAEAARVACYAAKMRAALEARPDLFFARSARLDPWAAADALLGWRDDLVAAGWTGGAVGSDRPDALALVEATGARLPPGLADRALEVCGALADRPSIAIESVRLVEPRALIEPRWAGLVDALEGCGVRILEAEPGSGFAGGDLGRVQRFLAGQAAEPLQGDGTVALVRTDTALTAAEALAEWLAHAPEDEQHGTVIVSTDGDTALLDLALQARGLPALGRSAASPWRGALQVLPLAIAAAWSPFDARAMLDLLMLQRSPLPRGVARRLAGALSREPGTGGAEWAAAWAAVEADVRTRVQAGELEQGDADRRLATWREWTTGGIHPRSEGMPALAAKAIASRVGRWAAETDVGGQDPLLMAVVGAADALVQSIDLFGMEVLPPLLLERMTAQALAEGAQNPDHVATAGGLRCVGHPAAIWDGADRVVWWDFKGAGDRVPSSPWDAVETVALEAAGCVFEGVSVAAERIGRSHANAVLRASDRLLLIMPSVSGAELSISHPLAHQLEPIVAPAREQLTWSGERLLEEAEHHLAGRHILRESIPVLTPPRQRAVWALPESARERLAGRVESATSFERLADCQLRWMLLDVLRLSRGRAAEIPGPDQLLGNLAHEIANHVLRPGPTPDPDAVLAKVGEEFDAILSAIATPLQQPEHAGELATARSRVPQALAQLAGLLRTMGVEVVGTELEREAAFADGLAVAGRLDLIVRHPERGLGVIDLKWSRSPKRRRNELAEGRALQLATYGAIADPEGGGRAEGAYYLLNQRRLVGLEGSFLADEVVNSDVTLSQTWTDLMAAWRTWRDLAARGVLIASGAEGAGDHVPADLAIAPCKEPCRYCELTGLCRVAAEEL